MTRITDWPSSQRLLEKKKEKKLERDEEEERRENPVTEIYRVGVKGEKEAIESLPSGQDHAETRIFWVQTLGMKMAKTILGCLRVCFMMWPMS